MLTRTQTGLGLMGLIVVLSAAQCNQASEVSKNHHKIESAMNMAFSDAASYRITGPHSVRVNYGADATHEFNFATGDVLISDMHWRAGAGGSKSFAQADIDSPGIVKTTLERACQAARQAVAQLDPKSSYENEVDQRKIAQGFLDHHCQ
jgi:hypothetical protein